HGCKLNEFYTHLGSGVTAFSKVESIHLILELVKLFHHNSESFMWAIDWLEQATCTCQFVRYFLHQLLLWCFHWCSPVQRRIHAFHFRNGTSPTVVDQNVRNLSPSKIGRDRMDSLGMP